MAEYAIKVKLEDGTLADFKSFVVVGKTPDVEITIEEFENLQEAKDSIQKMEQDNLFDFMEDKKAFISFTNHNNLSLIFIDWYANLDMFDKADFQKLLQKVVKIHD